MELGYSTYIQVEHLSALRAGLPRPRPGRPPHPPSLCPKNPATHTPPPPPPPAYTYSTLLYSTLLYSTLLYSSKTFKKILKKQKKKILKYTSQATVARCGVRCCGVRSVRRGVAYSTISVRYLGSCVVVWLVASGPPITHSPHVATRNATRNPQPAQPAATRRNSSLLYPQPAQPKGHTIHRHTQVICSGPARRPRVTGPARLPGTAARLPDLNSTHSIESRLAQNLNFSRCIYTSLPTLLCIIYSFLLTQSKVRYVIVLGT